MPKAIKAGFGGQSLIHCTVTGLFISFLCGSAKYQIVEHNDQYLALPRVPEDHVCFTSMPFWLQAAFLETLAGSVSDKFRRFSQRPHAGEVSLHNQPHCLVMNSDVRCT